jgi:hypothetical protein
MILPDSPQKQAMTEVSTTNSHYCKVPHQQTAPLTFHPLKTLSAQRKPVWEEQKSVRETIKRVVDYSV